MNCGFNDVAYLANEIIKALKEGSDIGSYETVLKNYEIKAKSNAYALSLVLEFLKNSYEEKLLGSELLGSALAHARNSAIELLDISSWAKHNLTTLASGSVTHPQNYEWETPY